jgi:predicted dehydrogenase
MVGGGLGSNIGDTHRFAARLDDRFSLVAGAFSADAERCRRAADEFGVREERAYPSWQEMAEREAERTDRIDAVAIVTPNHLHHPVAKAFIERGFHILCDKPLANSLEQARELRDLARKAGVSFAVTYNYSGYPMVRHARHLVRGGALGRLTMVQVEHASGWAAAPVERGGNPQALWRTDPSLAGPSTVVGDLGSHAHHLARFVTEREVRRVSAELSTVVPGRGSDDNAHLRIHLDDGVIGTIWASMVATGHEHGQRIRVYGDRAGLEWFQERPDQLHFREIDGPPQVLSRGAPWLSADASRATRIGLGHPEGFLEAFANVYRDFADALHARLTGEPPRADAATGSAESGPGLPAPEFPTVDDGVLGVAFVEACVASNRLDGAWVDVPVLERKQR